MFMPDLQPQQQNSPTLFSQYTARSSERTVLLRVLGSRKIKKKEIQITF